MSNWTSGYVADIAYTFGYYGVLNPLKIKLAFLNKGLVCPDVVNACELGFGQGLSVNIHAAASSSNWFGTDFNPSQAAFAQELDKESGASAKLYDESFEEFCKRDDLPEFEYIGLHGIWTWVSDNNRAIIVDFIRRKLKVGGVLYISYNTQPGWAGFIPLRKLMTLNARNDAHGGGIVKKVDNAIEFADRLLKCNPAYLRANPSMTERLKLIQGQGREYLAHEYFNEEWTPMFFSDMCQHLEPAKLQYACSAEYTEHVAGLNLTDEQQAFLAEIQDSNYKESVIDFMVNQQFRRDYWVKGARTLSPLARAEAIHKQKILLTTPRDEVSLKVKGALGEADMSAEVYDPILDFISDHKVHTLGEIEFGLSDAKIKLAHVIEAALVLSSSGHITSVQDEACISKAKKKTDKLNAAIMQRARASEEIRYLASPVTGGGMSIGRFQMLFLLAFSQGKKKPDEWVEFTWAVLSAQSQKLIKEGKVLESDEDNLQELKRLADDFAQKRFPIIRALQII